jgi:3D (Asp-Asp-Asp) domain-containing protein
MTGRFISQSVGRKLVAMVIAIVGFVLVYEVSTFDSRDAARQPVNPTGPAAGARLQFTATAYCKGRTTASGAAVRTGIAASDPSLLPVGSVVNVTTDTAKYNGVYTIMDTGPRVQGRILDLYMWSCHEALAFGRKPVQITVLRLGWNPSASSPSLVDRIFRRREAGRNAVLPAPPLPVPADTPVQTTAEPAPEPQQPPVAPVSAPPVEETAATTATAP